MYTHISHLKQCVVFCSSSQRRGIWRVVCAESEHLGEIHPQPYFFLLLFLNQSYLQFSHHYQRTIDYHKTLSSSHCLLWPVVMNFLRIPASANARNLWVVGEWGCKTQGSEHKQLLSVVFQQAGTRMEVLLFASFLSTMTFSVLSQVTNNDDLRNLHFTPVSKVSFVLA